MTASPTLARFAFVFLLAITMAARAPVGATCSATLQDGGATTRALATCEAALEREPDNYALLDEASRAAQAAGEKDKALWYAALALDLVPTLPAKEQVAARAALDARVNELDPLESRGRMVLDDYARALLAVGGDLAKRKSFGSAVVLLTRLARSAARFDADLLLQKIYADKKAVEALYDSGLDVPVRSRSKRKPAQIARLDGAHKEWDKAHEIKGEQYTVRTNIGIELAESISSAMEQMNRFYRTFFRVKERGGNTARVTLCVYKTREEFDLHETRNGEPPAPTVQGFFSPSELRVVAFDPRSQGGPLSELWSTLFHEASHQFTRIALTGGEFPTWLNEGTASYFEGAKLLSSGTVRFNLVPDLRLRELAMIFEEGTPTLHDVVTYMQPGSYPGEYYSSGWALVYFAMNYEDLECRRPYVEPYRSFLATYKSGGKHDVKGRFVEHFVTKAKQPGVKSFEDFEARWKAWMLDLHRLHFGGIEVADELAARARRQREKGQLDAAVESYAWALRKRPGDASILHELATVHEAQKDSDSALLNYRATLEALRAHEPLDEALVETVQQKLVKLDRAASGALAVADANLQLALVDCARMYHAARLPLTALSLLNSARELHGASPSFARLEAEISKSGVDARRWRRIPIEAEFEAWYVDEGWTVEGESLVARVTDPTYLVSNWDVPVRYRCEATIDPSKLDPESGFAALCFGVNSESLLYLGLGATGEIEIGALGEEGWETRDVVTTLDEPLKKPITFAVEVTPDSCEVFIDGKASGTYAFLPEELAGGVGLVVQSGTASVSDVRLRW